MPENMCFSFLFGDLETDLKELLIQTALVAYGSFEGPWRPNSDLISSLAL